MTLPQPKPGSGLNTILFDLDGTLAEGTWPEPRVGKPIKKAVLALVDYFIQGFEVVIFTARPKSHHELIAEWLRHVGRDGVWHLERVDVIDPLSSIVYDVITDKPRAAMYVDDRAVTFPEAFKEEESVSPRLMKEPGRVSRHFEAPECATSGCTPA